MDLEKYRITDIKNNLPQLGSSPNPMSGFKYTRLNWLAKREMRRSLKNAIKEEQEVDKKTSSKVNQTNDNTKACKEISSLEKKNGNIILGKNDSTVKKLFDQWIGEDDNSYYPLMISGQIYFIHDKIDRSGLNISEITYGIKDKKSNEVVIKTIIAHKVHKGILEEIKPRMIPSMEGFISSLFFRSPFKKKPIEEDKRAIIEKNVHDWSDRYNSIMNENKKVIETLKRSDIEAEKRLRKAEFKKVDDLLKRINKKNGSLLTEFITYKEHESDDFLNIVFPSDYYVTEDDWIICQSTFDGNQHIEETYPDKYKEWIKTGWGTELDKWIIGEMNIQFELCEKTWNEFVKQSKLLNLQTITVSPQIDGDKYEINGNISFHSSSKFNKILLDAGYKDPYSNE